MPSQNYLWREGGECREIEIYCKRGEREERRGHASRVIANEEVLGGGVSGNLGVAEEGGVETLDAGRPTSKSLMALSVRSESKSPLGWFRSRVTLLMGRLANSSDANQPSQRRSHLENTLPRLPIVHCKLSRAAKVDQLALLI